MQRLKARAGEADLDRAWMEEWSKRPIASRKSAMRPTPPATPSPPATSTCAPATTTTAPNASSRRARRSSRSIARRCAATTGAMARLHPDIERVEVPYEGQSLPAWFVKGRGLGKRPTVVLFDGMDNAKEMSVIFAGLDFAKRGHQHARDRRTGPVRAVAAAQHSDAARLRGRRASRPTTMLPHARTSIPSASP